MAHFTDVMTVYNHYKEDGKDLYKRTVVKGVQWSHNRTQTTISSGAITERKVESITIDFSRAYGNEEYINPVEFKKQTTKSGWTLNAKDNQDILVLGIGEDITDAYTIKHLREDFQYYGTVSEVSDNRNRDLLKNIKVVVK